MSGIWDWVEARWAVITVPGDEDHAQYVLERDLVPSHLLQYIAGYENGPRTWHWGSLPYKIFGQLLCGLLQPAADFDKIRKK